MRIQLTRTGGFGGPGHAASVDDASLGPEEREELRRLLEGVDLWSVPQDLVAPSPRPDRFRYRITAEEGGRRREIRASEEALPEPLRRLVRWLEQRARPSRP